MMMFILLKKTSSAKTKCANTLMNWKRSDTKMRGIRLFFIFTILSGTALSQRLTDVVHLSTAYQTSSARTLGLSGAQSALGADPGVIGYNPAGLGVFRRSEIGITSALHLSGVQTDYLNTTSQTNGSSTVVDNFGLIFSTTDDRVEKGFKSYTLGFTYNRAATFTKSIQYGGLNLSDSYTTYLAEYTTDAVAADPSFLDINKTINPIVNLSQLAWKSELIDVEDTTFVGLAEDGGMYQRIALSDEGFLNYWDIALGVNFSDRWYLGGGLRIGNYQLRSKNEIAEVDSFENVDFLRRFRYYNEYDVIGTGVGYSLGAIRRIGERSRISLAFHAPVNYISSAVHNYGVEDVLIVRDTLTVPLEKQHSAEMQEASFTIRAPMRITAGAYVQWQKNGFVTSDVEYQFKPGTSDDNLRSEIKSGIKQQFIWRTGAEYRKDFLRFRMGAAVRSNIISGEKQKFILSQSIGAGVRSGLFFADIYVSRMIKKDDFEFYTLNKGNQPTANIRYGLYQIGFSVGSKF